MNASEIVACIIVATFFTAIVALITYMCFPVGVITLFGLFWWACASLLTIDNKRTNGDN